jgi:L-glyceraldehyde 3-phosphate reductase
MKYRRLGASGIMVSEIALGSWLTYGQTVGEEGTRACVNAAFEAGINFIDTADVYAMGACEEVLGKVLADRPRKDYVLATKVFFPTGPGPNDRGLSRKHIRESIEGSLERLGTDYVELYQCHRDDPEVPLPELIRSMDDLIRRGLILHWGLSLWSAERIAEVTLLAQQMGCEGPVTNQPLYNMLERQIEDAVLPTATRLGLGQILYCPLAQGLLTGKYAGGKIPEGSRAADPSVNEFIGRRMTEENLSKVERLQAFAAERGLSLAPLALAWVLRHSGVSSAIIGATRPEHIRQNAEAAEVELDDRALDLIEDILRD